MKKRIVAIIATILLVTVSSISASAEINRQSLTDELFEIYWSESPFWVYNDYYKYTESRVKIEHDPIAAMFYKTLEAFISDCD